MTKHDPAFFVRYIHLGHGVYRENEYCLRLIPHLFRAENEGRIQILDFKQIRGAACEISNRDKKANA